MPRIAAPTGRRSLAALAGSLLAGAAAAQPGPALPALLPGGFPNRPLRVLVASATGGAPDAIFRLVQPRLSEFLGQPVLAENRAGAYGALAAAPVAAAAADGHTLLFDSALFLLAPFANRGLPFDPARDLLPVAAVAEVPAILAASAGTGIRDLRGYLEQARIAQDAMPYGTPGVGDTGHLAGLLLARRTGLRMEHITYRSPVRVARDLVTGTLASGYLPADLLAPIAAAGRVRALALTSAARPRVEGGLEGVPTIAESGFAGFDLTGWTALFCRAGTPEAVRRRLEEAVAFATADEGVRRRLAAMGAFVTPPLSTTAGLAAAGLEARLARARALLEGLVREGGISLG